MSTRQSMKRRTRAASPPRQESRGQLKESVDVEIGQLNKTHALLIAVQFAANHDCEFDVSDALAIIRDRVEESIERLDRAEVLP